MAGEFSDGEDSLGHEAKLVDATADTKVDLRLPLREPILQDRCREEIPIYSGVLDLAATNLAEQRRLAPQSGAKPKGSGHGLSLPLVMNTHDHMLGHWWQGPTRAVVDREQPGQLIRDCPASAAGWD